LSRAHPGHLYDLFPDISPIPNSQQKEISRIKNLGIWKSENPGSLKGAQKRAPHQGVPHQGVPHQGVPQRVPPIRVSPTRVSVCGQFDVSLGLSFRSVW